jgi:hypothetical protein
MKPAESSALPPLIAVIGEIELEPEDEDGSWVIQTMQRELNLSIESAFPAHRVTLYVGDAQFYIIPESIRIAKAVR